MTEAAIGRAAGAPEGSSQWIGWREAITPLSRASRRRWVVFYLVLLLVGGAVSGWPRALGLDGESFGPPLVLIVAMVLVFGMLRRGTRQLAAIDRPALDERDRQELHSAFRYAYPLFTIVMGASLVALAFILPDEQRRLRHDGFTEIHTGQFLAGKVLVGLLLVAALAVIAGWWRHVFGQPAVSRKLEAAAIVLGTFGVMMLMIGAFDATGTIATAWIGAVATLLIVVPLIVLGRRPT